jgi:type I restriction enzyme M protein
MLQHNPELKSQIDQLWNKFWAGRISNSLCTGIKSMCFFRLLIDKGLEVLFLISVIYNTHGTTIKIPEI